jgi:GT2 family glycosyltransferase
MNTGQCAISVAIPTYRREGVLLDTINYLLALDPRAAEILVIDQTEQPSPGTADVLEALAKAGSIRWLRLAEPSITHAMNVGLIEAQQDIILFVDDDIVPSANLIGAHARAHDHGWKIVAGQVLQPGEEPEPETARSRSFRFRSSTARLITEVMGGNFSTNRSLALKLGGFDENFVHAAYRFEADFAARALAAGEDIYFEPKASIRHLKAGSGGIRSYGNYLTTIKPGHAVGDYYYLLRAKQVPRRVLKMLWRPLRAVRTKHHLTHPWWIPGTLIAETLGFFWAVRLVARGPRLIGDGHRTNDQDGPRSSVVGRSSPQSSVVGRSSPQSSVVGPSSPQSSVVDAPSQQSSVVGRSSSNE